MKKTVLVVTEERGQENDSLLNIVAASDDGCGRKSVGATWSSKRRTPIDGATEDRSLQVMAVGAGATRAGCLFVMVGSLLM